MFCNQFLLSDDFLAFLAKSGLNPSEIRVLSQMLLYTECDNWIRVGQSQLAEDLDMQKQNVQRAVRALLEKQIILLQPSLMDKRRNDYRFNPCYGWRGSVKSWHTWLQEAGLQDKVVYDKHINNKVLRMRDAGLPQAQSG